MCAGFYILAKIMILYNKVSVTKLILLTIKKPLVILLPENLFLVFNGYIILSFDAK